MNAKNQLLHPLFLLCLFLLLLNDFYLKPVFANGLTGKLSDFAGLIIFPVFIACLLPASRKWIALVSGILFLIWKTPLVTPLIEWFNGFMPFAIHRVIDYSDYWALLVLPVAHRMLNEASTPQVYTGWLVRAGRTAIASLAFFGVCATSIAPKIEDPPGTVYIGQSYRMKKRKHEVIAMIQSLGYNVDHHDNNAQKTLIRDYYQTDNIIIYNDDSKPIDTILNVKYSLNELDKKYTYLTIINVTIDQKKPIQKWEVLKSLSKQYQKALKQQLIRKLK